MSFVSEFFYLEDRYANVLRKLEPEFGYDGLGEFLFNRTYSRTKPNGSNEDWFDVTMRCINGTFSIRKDWYLKNYIPWDEDYWQKYAFDMAKSMFKMEWCPPGRGLWAMGTTFVYERGSMALYNCGATKLKVENLAEDLAWLMDALMLGVGVGFHSIRDKLVCHNPTGTFKYVITDDREGWVNSVRLLIMAYCVAGKKLPEFIYSQIREAGLPIRGFGGIASGPESLRWLHEQIKLCFYRYMNEQGYDVVRLKTDLANLIGCCVVSGNVRRGAELGLGEVDDPIFCDLKDYQKYPDREHIGWMSNNSVRLYEDYHYDMLGEVAKRVIERGEPGIANLRNFVVGRVGKKNITRKDLADLLNPCGEITLEDKETCDVGETCPTRCYRKRSKELSNRRWYKACEYCTVYCCTIHLLPTHQPATNAVNSRNRRIGVGFIDYTGWRMADSQHNLIKYMREGYQRIRETGKRINGEAGIPEPIKYTTIKPGGTVPKMIGKTSGIGYPTFRETLFNIRAQNDTPVYHLLKEAGVPNEPEKYNPKNTTVFGYPAIQGPAKPAEEISVWEQAFNLVTVQREWADNAVSNTIYFKPKWKPIKRILVKADKMLMIREGLNEDEAETLINAMLRTNIEQLTKLEENVIDSLMQTKILKYEDSNYKIMLKTDEEGKIKEALICQFDPNHEENVLEYVISSIVPLTKSLSLLPHTEDGVYDQMPQVKLTKEQYKELKARIKKIDWNELENSEGVGERYCQGDSCERPS